MKKTPKTKGPFFPAVKILIADDSRLSRAMLQDTLAAWGYDVVAVENGQQAWEVLQSDEAPSMAIIDWVMPGMDGIEVCRRVRALNKEPYVYLFLLTSKTEKADIVQGIDAGADDYLTKPFDPGELQVRLHHGKRILDLQTELIAAREVLREQATQDFLTKVWNRGAILDILNKELSRAHREEKPLGLIMLDIDHFKHINDEYGHLSGDAVLRETAQRIRDPVRPYDHAGRYGGEEFLIVLPGCDADNAVQIAERFRVKLAAEKVSIGAEALTVTASFGAASTTQQGGLIDVERLIKAADMALYRAKEGGRNRVELATALDFSAEIS